MEKKIYLKIYDDSGTFRGVFTEFSFSAFTATINGGCGELTITLPRKFDDFDEGATIAFNNRVEIWVYDIFNPNGVRVFSGYIPEYDASLAESEDVTVRVFGYISTLQLDYIRDGSTIKIKYSATEIADIVTDLLDKFLAVNTTSPITYTGTSIALTGKSVTIPYDTSTYLNGIAEARNRADANWFYFLDADNVLSFNEIPTTPTHYFTMNSNIKDIRFTKSIVQLRNGIYFWNGLQPEDPEYISKKYEDTTSITTYGRFFEAKKDQRYKASTGSADEFANRYLETYKDPINTVTFTVLNNYPIESIKPGDTCKILNIKANNAFTDNMLITKITYSLDYVQVEVADTAQYIERVALELRQKIDEATYSGDGPTTYT